MCRIVGLHPLSIYEMEYATVEQGALWMSFTYRRSTVKERLIRPADMNIIPPRLMMITSADRTYWRKLKPQPPKQMLTLSRVTRKSILINIVLSDQWSFKRKCRAMVKWGQISIISLSQALASFRTEKALARLREWTSLPERSLFVYELSHVMRKPVFAICEQQRCRSACASAQSDQHLCCSLPG